jgi:hypothetical protein
LGLDRAVVQATFGNVAGEFLELLFQLAKRTLPLLPQLL